MAYGRQEVQDRMDEGRPALSLNLRRDYLRPGTLWKPIEPYLCWLYYRHEPDDTAVHIEIDPDQTVIILEPLTIVKQIEYISLVKVLIGTMSGWIKIERERSYQGDSGKLSLLFKSSRKWNEIFRRVDQDVVNVIAGKV